MKYCRHKQRALSIISHKCERDHKLSNFLSQQSSDPLCRRLELKDMLPMATQRLTKYPMLLENLLKCTPQNSADRTHIESAITRSRNILSKVNCAVEEAEMKARLDQIIKRIDYSQFDKSDNPAAKDFKVGIYSNI